MPNTPFCFFADSRKSLTKADCFHDISFIQIIDCLLNIIHGNDLCAIATCCEIKNIY